MQLDEVTGRLQEIVNSAMDAIISIDDDHNIILFNKRAETLFGYAKEDIIGKSVNTLMPKKYRPDHAEKVRFFANEGKTIRKMNKYGKIFGLDRFGRVFPAEASISRNMVNGKMLMTVILRDISERVEAENQIKKLNEELEEKVEQRTHELQEAVNELDEILSIISHDVRSPLTNIFLQAEMIENHADKLEKADIKEKMKRVKDGVELSINIFDNLLNIKKMEDGGIHFDMDYVDPVMPVRMAIDNSKFKASKKDIEIIDKLETNLMIRVNESKVFEVVDNILSNAIKFSPLGTKVFVNVKRKDDNVAINIQDQGPGLTAVDKKQLFKKYAKLSAKPTGNESKIGLGLNISKKFVELMGGHIYCESEYGLGANFVVEFPLITK